MSRKVILYFVLFIIFLILFSLYGFWVATHPPKFITKLTPKNLGWEYEGIILTTEDYVELSAWIVPSTNESDKVIILLHGYPADKANLIDWAKFLHEDFNLFFLDFRYFGSSQGSMTTIGFDEQKDLKAAIDYLKGKDFEKIGAMGFSLGGAVAIMTSSHDDRVKAIVSDSAFASIDLMGNEFYKGLFVLKYPLTILTKLWVKIFLGIDADKISPEKAALNLKIPTLLIHSKGDQTIPFENAIRLQQALKNNPQAQNFFLEEGIHGILPADLLDEYQEKVKEFFKKNLE